MDRSAFLVMDYQTGIADIPEAAPAVAATARLLEHMRSIGIPVIHVIVGFREGYPEIADANPMFAGIRDAGRLIAPQVIDALRPLPSEPVVTKRRVSAMSETELPALLRAYGCDHLILAGVATSGVILSTVRGGADLDYRLTVVSDCCFDRDAEVHDFLTTRILPRQARVVESSALISG